MKLFMLLLHKLIVGIEWLWFRRPGGLRSLESTLDKMEDYIDHYEESDRKGYTFVEDKEIKSRYTLFKVAYPRMIAIRDQLRKEQAKRKK